MMLNKIMSNMPVVDAVDEVAAGEFVLTETQIDFIIGGCVFLIFIFFLFGYILAKTYINKSCAGCKRLKNCEQIVKVLEEKING